MVEECVQAKKLLDDVLEKKGNNLNRLNLFPFSFSFLMRLDAEVRSATNCIIIKHSHFFHEGAKSVSGSTTVQGEFILSLIVVLLVLVGNLFAHKRECTPASILTAP